MVAKQRRPVEEVPLELRVRPFEPPKFAVLEAWYRQFQENMVGANEAWKRFDEALSRLKARRDANGWQETTYREQFKLDWAIQDALDDWRMYTAEVGRFKNALDVVAQMLKLREMYAGE